MATLDIQVVSLERSIERRTRITADLATADLRFQFLDATDALVLTPAVISSLIDPNLTLKIQGRQLSTSEIACADSHRRLYRKLIASRLAGMLILEDDAKFSANFSTIVAWLGQRAHHWTNSKSILYLGGREGFEDRKIAFARDMRAGPISGQSWKRVLQSENAIQRTCGYYVTRSAAQSMLHHENKIIMTADAWEYRIRKRIVDELWVLSPPCVFHPAELEASLIETDRDVLLRSRNRLIDRHPSLIPLSTSWQFLKKVIRRTILYPVIRRIG